MPRPSGLARHILGLQESGILDLGIAHWRARLRPATPGAERLAFAAASLPARPAVSPDLAATKARAHPGPASGLAPTARLARGPGSQAPSAQPAEGFTAAAAALAPAPPAAPTPLPGTRGGRTCARPLRPARAPAPRAAAGLAPGDAGGSRPRSARGARGAGGRGRSAARRAGGRTALRSGGGGGGGMGAGTGRGCGRPAPRPARALPGARPPQPPRPAWWPSPHPAQLASDPL